MGIGRIDVTPSHAGYVIADDGKDLIWTLDVRGEYGRDLGKLSIRTRGDLATGRLAPETIRTQE